MKSNFFITFLLIILLSLTLPSSGFWSLLPKNFSTNRHLASSLLYNYQHPLVPAMTAAVAPSVTAAGYLLIDNTTNKVLLSHRSDLKIHPASLTKLATALTALNIYPLDEVISVNQEYTECKVMGLKLNEKITVKSLVEALLVSSANDAAFTLAAHHPDGLDGFVVQMNFLAKSYRLNQTNFVNYDGIDQQNHYSTIEDLGQLARIAIRNPIIASVAKTKQLVVSDITGQISHNLTSTNELLGQIPEIEGLKTGWTPEAGGCFIGLINLNGHYLIAVVAQSPNRFTDTKNLVSWAKSNIIWQLYYLNGY